MNNAIAFTKSIFRGFGQIMLQGNYWTGILFFFAICYGSVWMGLAAIISNIIAVITAKMLKCDNTNIEDGLYGFNASLVGIALVAYFDLNIWVGFAIVIGAVFSTILMRFALENKFPAFTFPFVLITWILILVFKTTSLASSNSSGVFIDTSSLEDFWIEGHAFGQIIFQGSVISGLIFIIAVFINSPISALYGIVASILSVALSHYFNEPIDQVTAGMFSFNAVLCGIACSGVKRRDGLFVLLSVSLSTLIDIWMIELGLSTLTFPFVFSMWIIVLIKKYLPAEN